MRSMEHDNGGQQSWDPALWSIGAVVAIAILYLGCLA